MLRDGRSEHPNREFKGGRILGKSPDIEAITKAVSSFANSAGGVVVFGIHEPNKAASQAGERAKLEPADPAVCWKERFEDLLGGIHPPIPGVTIEQVEVKNPPGICFVVTVPQGATAHQASDKRYYRRRNFKAEPMDDWEVRDVMNRASHPNLRLFIRCRLNESEPGIDIAVENRGFVPAQSYKVVAFVPLKIGDVPIHVEEPRVMVRNPDGLAWRTAQTNAIGGPIFPGDCVLKTFPVRVALPHERMRWPFAGELPHSASHVRVVAYADAMPRIEIEIDAEKLGRKWFPDPPPLAIG